jgi:4-hydroxy-tetrahydrodipicolinate synthase
MKNSLQGVIAAAATPVTAQGGPDLDRFVRLCRWLLENGCDGLNICGTTGEATSFTREQRMAIMSVAAEALPRERLMVGTGAASVGDAMTLTEHAAALGFAGALLLPPFYYKGVADDGIMRYFERIVTATADRPIDLYLYNFPAMTGIEFSPALVKRLREKFGGRIEGLKDSSGNLPYAESIVEISPDLRVFPSNEAALLRARKGDFAGCISASANVNAEFCARAWREGDAEALGVASKIRALVSEKALIAGVKAVLAYRLGDAAFETLLPPLTPLALEDKQRLLDAVAPLLASSGREVRGTTAAGRARALRAQERR